MSTLETFLLVLLLLVAADVTRTLAARALAARRHARERGRP